jgi:hypothetical protein
MKHNETTDFYVAPNGNDANPGSESMPFATFERAQDSIRKAKQNGGKKITAYFRNGTYRFGETVILSLDDSAPSDGSVVYAAYPGERPVFSAGIRIPGQSWKKLEKEPDHLPERARGHIWTVEVPEAVRDNIPIRSLFEGPEMLPRARGKGFSVVADPVGSDEELRRSSLRYPDGALEAWPDIASGELVVIPTRTWTMNILPVERIDTGANEVFTRFPHTYPMRPNHFDESVWLENVLAVLDKPGEWVYDGNGRIYYWPKTGQPADGIEYPAVTEMIRIEGAIEYDGVADEPVRGIRFEGITFTHNERYQWHGLTGWGIQHDWEAFDRPTAMLRFRGAEECEVKACRFTCGSGAGVRLDLHCKKVVITRCHIDQLGGCGVVACGYGPGTKDVNRGNEISHNHIHHIGLAYWHSPGVFIWQSGDNTIAHNHIHHTGYTGIVVSGRMRWDRDGQMECSRSVRWNETATVVGPDYEQQVWHQAWYPDWKRRNPLYHGSYNRVEYNDIHDVMQIMGDGNGVYISGTGRENVVRYNAVHDCPSTTMAEGIRCDDDQHDTTLHGNLIYNLGGFATGITIKGINVVTNNVIACGSPEKTRRAYISLEVGPLHGAIMQRNILYMPKAAHKLYYQGPRYHGEGPEPLLRDCEADRNLYWCLEDPTRCERHLEIERQYGIEQGSVVADPLFVDPENGDFHLRNDSPALALGFERIPIEEIGIGPENIK